jgi:hypothetical protein
MKLTDGGMLIDRQRLQRRARDLAERARCGADAELPNARCGVVSQDADELHALRQPCSSRDAGSRRR